MNDFIDTPIAIHAKMTKTVCGYILLFITEHKDLQFQIT